MLRDFEDCKLFFKRDPVPCVKSDNSQSDPDHLLVQCSMGSVSCNGRSPAVHYGSMFLHQIILYMTTALLPFPGAEGISEFSFVKLFAGMLYFCSGGSGSTGESWDQLLFSADIKWNLWHRAWTLMDRSADQSGTNTNCNRKQNEIGKILTRRKE